MLQVPQEPHTGASVMLRVMSVQHVTSYKAFPKCSQPHILEMKELRLRELGRLTPHHLAQRWEFGAWFSDSKPGFLSLSAPSKYVLNKGPNTLRSGAGGLLRQIAGNFRLGSPWAFNRCQSLAEVIQAWGGGTLKRHGDSPRP